MQINQEKESVKSGRVHRDFYLEILGTSDNNERDAEKEINEILEKINTKSVACGQFELNPLSLSARES